MNRTKRSYGRDFAPDPRDYAMAPVATACRRRRWRDNQWSGDQGETPHCVGFAWAHWLASSPVSQFLNPDGIYELAQFLDEWEGEDYDGTSVRAGAKVLTRLGHVAEYRFTVDEAVLRGNVLDVGPVVIGVNWYAGMETPDRDGLVHPTGRLRGGHALLVVGYLPGFYTLKNSWGLGWGLGGHAWIADERMQQLLNEDGEACLAVERKVKVPK